jgi:hypothetical protein
LAYKRGGTHKLECAGCDNYVYATVAALERHGLPLCGCGRRFEPVEAELCLELDLRDTWVFRVFTQEASRTLQGQASHVQRGRSVRNPEQVALDRMAKERAESARVRRITAIQPKPVLPF